MKLVGVFFLLCLDAISMEGGIFIRGNGGISMSGGNPGCAPVIHSSNGPVDIQTNSVDIDHGTIAGEGVHVAAKDVRNRAGKIYSSTSICIDADNQRNETVINKWSQDIRHGRNYAHAEGISSIDKCELRAPIVIQKGKHIENIGIKVSADVYEDHGKWTSNMPARATLHNYSHVEKRRFFSRASADCRRLDDVLFPTRFDVGQFRSLQAEGESAAVQFGYTMIKADAGIEVTKDRKEDVLVQERHFMEMHQKKSGLSLFGGVNVPDPTAQLQAMHQAHKNDNMAGLTASSISAAAQAINIGKTIGAMTQPMSTFSMLQLLSRFVNGPSLQFGTREVSTRQFTTIAHGNYFEAPRMKFCNAEKSTFIGQYHGRDIDIQTRTLITFAMPHEMETNTTVRQTGVNLDLLSFAMALLNPEISGITNALLVSSGASISSQTVRSRSVYNVPTSIIADWRLNISAENGLLEHAKIKAGIVHAVFSKDMVLKSLANERWTQKSGGSVSFSPGALIGFDELAQALVDTTSSASLSLIDSVSFERIIDDFAELVGEEEFYLRVGNILRTESAFLGHVRHDPMQEHIEAAEIQHTEVPQFKTGHDRSFSISIPDIAKLVDAVKTHVIADAMEQGASRETAEQMAEAEIEVVVAEAEEFQEEAQKVVTIANQAKKKASEKQEYTVDDKVIELLLTPSEGNESLLEKQVSECFSNLIYSQIALSPREQMMAFVPKNKGEEALKQATILRYKLEDFVEKHPEAAELCSKMFIGVIYALQGIEYGVAGYLAGPVGIAAKFATQATTAFAIDTTIEESSDQAARCITQVETLQQEFKNTIKFCTYAGLCAGSVKAGKKLISSLSKNTVEQVAFRRPISLDIIKESEMVKRAAELPGDWKGQFKLIKEIPQTRTGTEFASEVYCRQVLFKDPKTGQMFRVFQRNDIDPNYVIPKGRNRGKTNLEAMLKGHTPYTINGQMVQLHHMGQNARGSLVEVTEKTHRAFPHKQFGQNNPHPTNPVIRSEFDSIREAYWRAYAEQFK